MELTDRILEAYSKGEDVNTFKARLLVILNDYNIVNKSEALAVRSETKNELLMKRFTLAKKLKGCSNLTIRNYLYTIRKLLDEVGKDADEITSGDIQMWLAELMIKGKANSTIDNYRMYISSFYAFLLREEMIEKNPMLKIDPIKSKITRETAFSAIELERLRDAAQTAKQKCLIEMLLSTGCRISEVAGIKLTDITNDAVTVMGKGNKERVVYLNGKAQYAIDKYLKGKTDNNIYLFESRDGKTHATTKGMWKSLKQIGKIANVDNVHPHRFRRTFATGMLERGCDLMHISRILGHADTKVTQVYLAIDDASIKRAYERYAI